MNFESQNCITSFEVNASLKLFLLALTVAVIWGFNFVAIKWGISEIPPFLLTFLRFVATAFPLIFFLKKPKTPFRLTVWYGLVLGVFYFGLLYMSMRAGLPAGLCSILIQTQVFFTFYLSKLLLKDTPRFRQYLGSGIAFVGIFFVSRDLGKLQSLSPLLMVLGAAVVMGYSNILLKKISPHSMLAFLVWSSLVPALPLLLMSLAFEHSFYVDFAWTHLTWRSAFSILYMALISTLIGFGIWGYLLKTYSPNRVVPFILLVPLFGVLSSTLVFGESFSPTQALGGALLMVGLAVAQLRFKKIMV